MNLVEKQFFSVYPLPVIRNYLLTDVYIKSIPKQFENIFLKCIKSCKQPVSWDAHLTTFHDH